MSRRIREVIESPVSQGEDEKIAYVVTIPYSWGSSPTSPTVVIKDDAGTDTSSTNLSGSPTVADFQAQINGTPSNNTLVYDNITGSESNLARIKIFNLTRSEYMLIDTVDTGTNTITFTSPVPSSWADGDTIVGRGITTPLVQSLTAGSQYRLEIKWTDSGNTLEAYLDILGEE